MAVTFAELENAISNLEEIDYEIGESPRELVDKILKYARAEGLLPQHISRIIKICTTTRINPLNAKILVKSLIPRECIPEDAVICALARICSGICSLKLQKLILEWISSMFHIIQPKANVYCLYGMLFNLLDNDVIHAPLCYLLTLMTRRQDATGFRLLQLAQHRKKIGNTPHLRGLVKSLQIHLLPQKSSTAELGRDTMKWQCTTLSTELPANYALLFRESGQGRVYTSSQRRHILAISPVPNIEPHLELWLHHKLSALMEDSAQATESSETFDTLFMLKHLLRNTSGVWGAFLYDYSLTWNGSDHLDIILKFVANIPLRLFVDLRERVFAVLKKLFTFSEDSSFKYIVIENLSDLTCSYIVSASSATMQNPDYGVSNITSIVKDLVKFVENMVLESLLLNEDNCTILHATFEYWEMVSSTLLSTGSNIIIVPHFFFIYKALFGTNGAFLSSVCEILHYIMRIFMSSDCTKPQKTLVNRISEVYQVLWKHGAIDLLCERGFIADHRNTDQDAESGEINCCEGDSKPCFSLHKHPALLTFFAIYTENEGQSQPDFSADMLQQDDLVQMLKNEGMTGIVNFLRELSNLVNTKSCNNLGTD